MGSATRPRQLYRRVILSFVPYTLLSVVCVTTIRAKFIYYVARIVRGGGIVLLYDDDDDDGGYAIIINLRASTSPSRRFVAD